MNINVASIANAKVIYLDFHLKTCQTVANNGTGLKQLWMTCDRWHVTGDTWHVTLDRWQVTDDMWKVTGDRWQVTGDRWQVTGDRWQWKKREKIGPPISLFSLQGDSMSKVREKKVNVQKWIFFWWNVKDNKANWWYWPFFLNTFVILGCF